MLHMVDRVRQTRASGALAGVAPSVLILSEKAGIPLCSG